MLEYVKTILGKVSFDNDLFIREVKKAFAQLTPSEQNQLKNWLLANYQDRYQELLSSTTQNQPVQ